MKNKLLLTFILLPTISFAQATSTTLTEEEVLSLWKPYVVKVTCVLLNKDGSKKSYSEGTGILGNYKKGIQVLSNRYIYNVKGYSANYCEVTIPTSKEVFKIDKKNWSINSQQERILFSIKQPSEHLKWLMSLPDYKKTQIDCKSKQILVGSDLAILGYPKGSDKSQASVIKGKVLSTSSSTSEYITSDIKMQEGLAGGVTISQSNNCYVGIATFAKKEDSTKSLILDVNKFK